MPTSRSRPRPVRQTVGLRRGGRSARVVAAVLEATLEELGTEGYGGLRIDEVARKAAVNKTTIYRRWPTRAALVEAALRTLSGVAEAPRGQSVREDLLTDLMRDVEWFVTPLGRGICRMIQAERLHGSEIVDVVESIRAERLSRRESIVRAGIERGELPRATSPRLITEVIQSAIFSRIIHLGERMDHAQVAAIVDLVLAGARAVAT